MRPARSPLGVVALACAALLGSCLLGAQAEGAKKRKAKVGPVKVANNTPAAVPDAVPGTAGVVRSTISVGKKHRGKRIADVDLTFQTTGVGGVAGADLIMRLTAPNGATTNLMSGLDAQSIGPLTYDDEAKAIVCNDTTPPCDNPDATLFTPFAGRTAPDEPLRILDGGSARGVWTLLVYDMSPGRTSVLTSWSLRIVPQRPAK